MAWKITRATVADDLVLDPNIRSWVFIPIILVTFLVGLIRHYVSIFLTTFKPVELLQVQDSQAIMRARLLRENGKYLCDRSYQMRRSFFNDEDKGYFKTQKREAKASNPMVDPSMLSDMLKGNLNNMIPTILIGGWINWTFSGFLTTKVPFPLTLRFKSMLQRGIELQSLDASWVSSASWYFLNVFGLRSIYSLVLGEENGADDQTIMMQENISGAAMSMPPDPKAIFKAEWEALEVAGHRWILKDVERREQDRVGLGRDTT